MSEMSFNAHEVLEAVSRNKERLQKLEEDTGTINKQLKDYRFRLQDDISARTEQLLKQAESKEREIAEIVREMNDGLERAARQLLSLESE